MTTLFPLYLSTACLLVERDSHRHHSSRSEGLSPLRPITAQLLRIAAPLLTQEPKLPATPPASSRTVCYRKEHFGHARKPLVCAGPPCSPWFLSPLVKLCHDLTVYKGHQLAHLHASAIVFTQHASLQDLHRPCLRRLYRRRCPSH